MHSLNMLHKAVSCCCVTAVPYSGIIIFLHNVARLGNSFMQHSVYVIRDAIQWQDIILPHCTVYVQL